MITDQLNEAAAHYSIKDHEPSFTAQHLAQKVHIRGRNVAKPVIVKADDRFYMCVVPADCKVDMEALRSVLDAERIQLASEKELLKLFPDADLGAEPPFGSFYGVPTIMDDRLENDKFIVFEGGSHRQAIMMDMQEYLSIEEPRIFSFSYHI